MRDVKDHLKSIIDRHGAVEISSHVIRRGSTGIVRPDTIRKLCDDHDFRKMTLRHSGNILVFHHTNRGMMAAIKIVRRKMKLSLGQIEGSICQQCHERPGTQLHEIVSRAHCQGAPLAFLTVCNQLELCVLLCPSCHIADGPNDALLIGQKADRYGFRALNTAIDSVNDHLKVRKIITHQTLLLTSNDGMI